MIDTIYNVCINNEPAPLLINHTSLSALLQDRQIVHFDNSFLSILPPL